MRAALVLLVLAATLTLVTSSVTPGPIARPGDQTGPAASIAAGPYASLLASSADLGSSRDPSAQLIVALRDGGPPDSLFGWARTHLLSVRWKPGQRWAVVEGSARDLAGAFGVEIHDYRARRGQLFYAAQRQPAVPDGIATNVTGLGRILSYTPFRASLPAPPPLDVPDQGLAPEALRNTYGADQLFAQGFTGKGQTIIVFAFDGYRQSDLDTFSTTYRLPALKPIVVGGQADRPRAETTMDLSILHAIAPDAQMVVVNARPTVEGDGAYSKIGQMMEDADRRFPGAIWSFSISWGCDKLVTAPDLAPAQSALRTALARGTTAFMATGDLAGLECRNGDDWSAVPGLDHAGLNSVGSLPEVVNVGGTSLSTRADGGWLDEQAWFDVPLTLGTSGGVSELFDRPEWQDAAVAQSERGSGMGRRLTPDVAAVADPFTGVRFVLDGKPTVGGGTSQAAPIWAGLTALMNQYFQAKGGPRVGDLNPLLYRIAAGARLPAFRDVTLGGNAIDDAHPGYDLVTGLGTPNVGNLVENIDDIRSRQQVAP